MIITVASYKGGVGKTTTALHLAAFFQRLAPTLLVDGDAIRTSIKWSQRGAGNGLPFTVVDEKQTAIATRDGHFQHVIMDTEANPSIADFQEVAKGCDLLVIPAVPETVATDGLTHTLAKLHELGSDRYRVLLTMVHPSRRTEADQLRTALIQNAIPVFVAEIPRLAAFDKAAAAGVPVYAANDSRAARAWAAYEAVGKEIGHGRPQK
jgi:chromosome partitioning protein